MNQFTCITCNKSFSSIMSLAGHKRMHGVSNGKITKDKILCSCIYTHKCMEVKYLYNYQLSIKPCKQCNTLFKSSAHSTTFCSHSCSASYNNALRGPMSESTKGKIRTKIQENQRLANTDIKPTILGPYSKMFKCTCKHCSAKFISRAKRQYCDNHKSLYSKSAKSGYKFTFNIYNFPDLFDINWLNSIGWFAPGGKSGKWNINGLSRDHKISITESIKNNYDPFYITHPLNCELMPHSQNNIKKTKSSISYCDLVKIVNQYELTK